MSTPEDPRTGQPTVVHATHWKAGSQWVRAVLRTACEDRMAGERDEDMRQHVLEQELLPGAVYSPVYLPRGRLLERFAEFADVRRFFVMRDLRDTLVSWYFSVARSHSENPAIVSWRSELVDMSPSEGLVWCLDRFAGVVALQQAWQEEHGDLIVRYEDLIADEHAVFERIFAYCGIDLAGDALDLAVRRHNFAHVSGRAPGDEEVSSHHRKGVAGDWQNYFDNRVKDAFKERYNAALVAAGYERDDAW